MGCDPSPALQAAAAQLPQLMCQQEHDGHHWGQVGFGSVGSLQVRGEAHGWESVPEKFIVLVAAGGLWSLADL